MSIGADKPKETSDRHHLFQDFRSLELGPFAQPENWAIAR